MTMFRGSGIVKIQCDVCGYEIVGGVREYKDFISQRKQDGWKFRRAERELKSGKMMEYWEHYCPECVSH